MRGKTLLVVRRLHLYLSVFFTPLLLLFVITGWAQTADFDHSSLLMRQLSLVHKHQYFPAAAAGSSEGKGGTRRPFAPGKGGDINNPRLTAPTRWLIEAMCACLFVSIALGLALAFTMVRNRLPVWIALILGVGTPVLLLTLAHFR